MSQMSLIGQCEKCDQPTFFRGDELRLCVECGGWGIPTKLVFKEKEKHTEPYHWEGEFEDEEVKLEE